MKKDKWTYLGDGVYARYNGWHVILITGTPDNIENTIYLEPDVISNLEKFISEDSDPDYTP
jgi:hypothetical protein